MRIAIDARKLRDHGIGTYIRNLLRHLSRLDQSTEYVLLCQKENCGVVSSLGPNFRAVSEEAGAYFSQFYEPVATDHVRTWTPEYASAIVRHTFDRSSPIAQYATIPRAFVFIQRINLGLYALLGDLRATGNYRKMAEELWPFADGPPSTPLGEAEAAWLRTRRA